MIFSTKTNLMFCAALCAGATLLSADTVRLRTGETLHGTFMGGTSRQIRMDQAGEIRTFDVNQVESVARIAAGGLRLGR